MYFYEISAAVQDVLTCSIFSMSARSWQLFMEWMHSWLTKTTKVIHKEEVQQTYDYFVIFPMKLV